MARRSAEEYRAWSTATRGSRRSSTRRRRSTRSRARSSARARRGGGRRATSRTSAPSPGCSGTQARILPPAWYGLGSALRRRSPSTGLETLREMERDWPFFSALLSNAEMACAKADLAVGRRHAELVEDRELATAIWDTDRVARTCDALLAVTGQERLLDRERPAARLDRPPQPLRRPDVAAPDRAPAAGPAGGRRRRRGAARASFLAINGIAAGHAEHRADRPRRVYTRGRSRADGGIGRRARLRAWSGITGWRFESSSALEESRCQSRGFPFVRLAWLHWTQLWEHAENVEHTLCSTRILEPRIPHAIRPQAP